MNIIEFFNKAPFFRVMTSYQKKGRESHQGIIFLFWGPEVAKIRSLVSPTTTTFTYEKPLSISLSHSCGISEKFWRFLRHPPKWVAFTRTTIKLKPYFSTRTPPRLSANVLTKKFWWNSKTSLMKLKFWFLELRNLGKVHS